MNVGTFGTGVVGQTIAGNLAEIGHQVMVGTRNVDITMASKFTRTRNVPAPLAAVMEHDRDGDAERSSGYLSFTPVRKG